MSYQETIIINSAPSEKLNKAKIGDTIFYHTGEYAGIIKANEADRFILDKFIKDRSRKAYILKKNEDVVWFIKNDASILSLEKIDMNSLSIELDTISQGASHSEDFERDNISPQALNQIKKSLPDSSLYNPTHIDLPNKLTFYPHPDSEGFIGVAIYDSFGGFPIYRDCLRHDRTVIEEASSIDKNVKIVYIPDYMIDFYTITEYDGWEECVLDINGYKISEIEKITRSTKEIWTKMKAIELVLDGNYPTEPI